MSDYKPMYRGDHYGDWPSENQEGHFAAREAAEIEIEAELNKINQESFADLHKDSDGVDRSHYRQAEVQPIEIIEMYDLNFNIGNCLKYILRADHKDQRDSDIKKAIWYLQRELTKGNK